MPVSVIQAFNGADAESGWTKPYSIKQCFLLEIMYGEYLSFFSSLFVKQVVIEPENLFSTSLIIILCSFYLKNAAIFFLSSFLLFPSGKAQFHDGYRLTQTTEMGRAYLSIYKQYNGLRFSGYVQPVPVIQTKGAHSFNGGEFSAKRQ
jgi:hypothetical protein